MPAQHRSGFTLVELLVAVVISGILVTAILQLVRSQGQFARVQTAREEVQQNARAAVDLIAAELRGVGWNGIGSGDVDEISFASPTAWGVACGDAATGVAVLFPPDAVTSLNMPAAGLAITQTGGAAVFFTVTDVTEGAGLGAVVNLCRATLQPDPDIAVAPKVVESRVRVYAGLSGVAAGTSVYRYADVGYAIGEIDGRRWILRNGEQFAGPVVESGEGLRFRYLAADGSTSVSADAARTIGISVTTQSRGSVNQSTQTDRASTVVYLRNRS